MYFATSANTVYFLVSQVLVAVSTRAEETIPRKTHDWPRFITKPPPLSPVHGPVPFNSPVLQRKLYYSYIATSNALPAQKVRLEVNFKNLSSDLRHSSWPTTGSSTCLASSTY